MPHAFPRAIAKLALSILVVVITGAAASAAQAHAITCNGTETASFTPPLTDTLQPVTISVSQKIGPCGPQSLIATNDYPVTRNYSCNIFTGGLVTNTFTWSNGEQSTYSFNARVAIVDGSFLVAQIGKISSGLYAGRSAIGIVTLAPDETLASGNCETGLNSASGSYSLTIL
jgi:hypothetical protein